MVSLVPEVHLFICLDPRISPGPILHCLDMARAQDWQQETILVCDESWKSFVNIDQPVLFIDKKKVFGQDSDNVGDSIPYLESFLEQLDHFEIQKITQIGELTWGRWLQVYFSAETESPVQQINWEEPAVSSLQIINDVAQELALDITMTARDGKKSGAVYVDPYCDEGLSQSFIQLIESLSPDDVPNWLTLVCKEKDEAFFIEKGFEESLIDFDEMETSLFNQPVLCFSDSSPLAHTSRSYNVATFGQEKDSSLFVPGDISIKPAEEIHIQELFNILAYWRGQRLKELAFQWLNMGIDIHCVENFHGRVVKRNLLNYSSDLYNCQILIQKFLYQKSHGSREFSSTILEMRKKVENDPYTLSFSLKILLMITERMIASANTGERLFQRLGSDYHRIIIGEALIEGLIETSWDETKIINIKKKLEEFHRFLIKVDFTNDQMDSTNLHKETA